MVLEEEQDGVSIIQTGLNQAGTKEFSTLFEERIFDYPKPVQLIQGLIRQSSLGKDNDEPDYILDFFAGSGTTGQAVLEINSEDGGNRKFILVQLPEPTAPNSSAFKNNYHNLVQITRERVRRVIDRLNTLDEGKLHFNINEDRGFRAFSLTASNFKEWDNDTKPQTAEELEKSLEQLAMNLNSNTDEQSILFEILLKAGLPLSARIESLLLANERVYAVEEKQLYVCLANPISEATLREIITLHPQKLVCLDVAFVGNDQLKTNTALQMKNAHPEIQFWTI